MVNLEEFDKFLKNILIQYLNEPEIISIIEKNITKDINEKSIEKNDANSTITVDTGLSKQLIDKIDDVVKSQQKIENLVENIVNKNKTEVDAENERNKIDEYKKQIQYYEKETEKNKENYNSLKEQYNVFEKPLEVWNSIKSLNDKNKKYLEDLCGSASAMSILSLGRGDGKIEQLWQYLRDEAVGEKQDADQIEKLAGYFEFCIDFMNEFKDDKEKYCVFDVEPGNEFDMDLCIKTTNSKQIGRVKRTIIKGVKKGETVRLKAIVSVE